jgi:succinoglycan biosynthesis protein ExoO
MDESTKNLVSVILPAYNAEKYIGEAIESVLKQTYPYFELIVVDDGSKDNTADVVKSFNDNRIHLIQQLENKGVSEARNTGMEYAKGRWFAHIDADDQWLPERLEELIKIQLESGDGYFVADDSIVCFDTPTGLREWDSSFKLFYGIKPGEKKLELSLFDFLKLKAPLIHPLIPAKPIIYAGLKYNPMTKGIEDFEFNCNLFRIGLKLKLYTKAFYLYRLTPGSITDQQDFLKWKILTLKSLIGNEGFTTEEKSLFKDLLLETEKEKDYRQFSYALKSKQWSKVLSLFLKHPLLLIQLLIHLPHSLRYRITAKIYGARIK